MNKSFRGDGKEEIVIKIECGSTPGFATSGWQASSTYTVNVISEDSFQSVIDQLKQKAGEQCRADEIFGVDKKSGNRIVFDPSKTIAENGITPTSHPIMRFPSKFAGKVV